MLQKTNPSIEELLINAITNGSIAQVESLVKQSANLNISFNPLYLAFRAIARKFEEDFCYS